MYAFWLLRYRNIFPILFIEITFTFLSTLNTETTWQQAYKTVTVHLCFTDITQTEMPPTPPNVYAVFFTLFFICLIIMYCFVQFHSNRQRAKLNALRYECQYLQFRQNAAVSSTTNRQGSLYSHHFLWFM